MFKSWRDHRETHLLPVFFSKIPSVLPIQCKIHVCNHLKQLDFQSGRQWTDRKHLFCISTTIWRECSHTGFHLHALAQQSAGDIISFPGWCLHGRTAAHSWLDLQVPAASPEIAGDKLMVIPGKTSSQPPTSHSHPTLLTAFPRAGVINLSCSLYAALKTRASYRFPDHATGLQNDTVK